MGARCGRNSNQASPICLGDCHSETQEWDHKFHIWNILGDKYFLNWLTQCVIKKNLLLHYTFLGPILFYYVIWALLVVSVKWVKFLFKWYSKFLFREVIVLVAEFLPNSHSPSVCNSWLTIWKAFWSIWKRDSDFPKNIITFWPGLIFLIIASKIILPR